jgi:ABC-type sugar transport system substrate-binding protein
MRTVHTFRTRLLLAGLLVCLTVNGCSSGTKPASSGTNSVSSNSCPGSATYTSDEILAAVKPQTVVPVYAVPKCQSRTTMAFLDIDASQPFFAEVESGLRAAAKFYGVDLLLTDLHNNPAQTVPQYQQVSARHPEVVGTLVNSSEGALYARTKSDGVPLILLEGSFATPPTKTYTLISPTADRAKGAAVGKMLGQEAKKRMADSWKGHDLYFVEAGQKSLDVVNKRMTAALAAFRGSVQVPDSRVIEFDTSGKIVETQQKMTDVLTAHPNAVFAVAPLNDEVGTGAQKAIQAAGLTNNAIISLLGGDRLGRDAIRNDKTGLILGAVYANPFQEGWNWIEAGLAVKNKAKYNDISSADLPIITKATVDQLFPHG